MLSQGDTNELKCSSATLWLQCAQVNKDLDFRCKSIHRARASQTFLVSYQPGIARTRTLGRTPSRRQ